MHAETNSQRDEAPAKTVPLRKNAFKYQRYCDGASVFQNNLFGNKETVRDLFRIDRLIEAW